MKSWKFPYVILFSIDIETEMETRLSTAEENIQGKYISFGLGHESFCGTTDVPVFGLLVRPSLGFRLGRGVCWL